MEYPETLDQRHKVLRGSGKPAAALADDTKTLCKQICRKDGLDQVLKVVKSTCKCGKIIR